MSLAVLDGAEHRLPRPPFFDISSDLPSYSTTVPRFGTGVAYSLAHQSSMRWTVPSAQTSTEIWCGFASRQDTTVSGTAAPLWALFGDGSSVQHLGLYSITTGTGVGRLDLYRGVLGTGTLLGSTGTILTVGNWDYIELYGKIDDTTGAYELRVNGVNLLSATGVDTRNGGTDPKITMVGCARNFAAKSMYYDDLYAVTGDGTGSTGFQSEIKIEGLKPNGAGNYTQLTPSAGSNWQNVDEVPFSTADYNGSATPGQKDTYAYENLVATTGTILGTVLHTGYFKSNAGFISGRRVVRIAGTDYNGSDYPSFSASQRYASKLFETSPATSTAWTISEVNGIEAGFEVRSA